MNRLCCVTIVALGLVSAAASAQQAPAQPDKEFVEARGSVKPVPLPPGGPTPRMSDGKPDFSGVWFPGPTGRANAWSVVPDERVVENPIPFQPWALEKYKAMSRTEVELYGNANVRCLPPGTPGMMTENPYAIRFLTKPGLFVHLIENNNRWRVVHTDGRPHKPKEEQEPLFNGDMVGKWEGDTLVIDTISIDERTWIRDGWFHSDELHVIERFRRPSMNIIEYQFTIEDPKVLTKPWTSAWRRYTLSVLDEDLTENFCTNNEQVEQFLKLLDKENQGTAPKGEVPPEP
jgi:hypothetical protein